MTRRSIGDRFIVFSTRVLASRWFFWATIVWLAIQASYVALTARFSMAFDEYYHLGTIQQYAHVWWPWSVRQLSGPATLGSSVTDGSYLFHYVMSFPYRLISVWTHSDMTHIIILRLIDVCCMLAAFVVYRRLLHRVGLPQWANHLLLLVIAMLPVTAFLAGQLTYDVLFFLVSGAAVLALITAIDQLRAGELRLGHMSWTFSLLLLASQVKYAFLPMALGGGVFGLWLMFWEARQGRLSWRVLRAAWSKELRKPLTLLLLVLMLVSGVLFSLRYGENMLQYGTPVPDCAEVLGKQRCLAYDPYGRDEGFKQVGYQYAIRHRDVAAYPWNWGVQMLREFYFTVGPRDLNYPTGQPIQPSYAAGCLLAVLLLAACAAEAWFLWRSDPRMQLLIILILFYVGFLFVKNLESYLATGIPVAIHGRYILQLLPLIGVFAYFALRHMLKTPRSRRYAAYIVGVLVVTTLYGGGITPFIIRSWDGWYWPYAVATSRVVRSLLWPFVPQ